MKFIAVSIERYFMNGCLNITDSSDATILATFHEGKTSINQPQGRGFVGALTQVHDFRQSHYARELDSRMHTHTHTYTHI